MLKNGFGLGVSPTTSTLSYIVKCKQIFSKSERFLLKLAAKDSKRYIQMGNVGLIYIYIYTHKNNPLIKTIKWERLYEKMLFRTIAYIKLEEKRCSFQCLCKSVQQKLALSTGNELHSSDFKILLQLLQHSVLLKLWLCMRPNDRCETAT